MAITKTLQDTRGNQIYPITTSEAIIMSGTVNTLTEELDSLQYQINNIGSGIEGTIQEVQIARGNYSSLDTRLDNTDTNISTLSTTKAPLNSPVFTGVVSGITKTMIGLPNVDNTSDINKPISSAQQTALNTKAGLVDPTFTGTLTSPIINASSSLKIGGITISASAAELNYVDGVTSSIQTQLNSKQSTLSAGFGDTTNPYGSKLANYILAAPNGTNGAPSFRAIVAADIPTLNQNTTGSAATLTTARTLTIGASGKTFNGSADASWSLSEIGAQAAGSYANADHTHNYLPLTGGTVTGSIIVSNSTQSTTISQSSTGLQFNSTEYGGAYRLPRIYTQTTETPPSTMQDGDLLFVYTA